MASEKIASLFWILACFCASTDLTTARMNGAPPGTCGSMKPQHGVEGDDTLMPFYNLSMTYDATTKKFMVHLEKVRQDGFKGFLIRIAESSPPAKYVEGKFEVPTDQSGTAKILTCDNGPNAVTHVDNKEKEKVAVTWTPDAKRAKDNVHIMALATVVKVKAIFVEGMKSASLNMVSPGSPVQPPAPAPSQSPAHGLASSSAHGLASSPAHGLASSPAHGLASSPADGLASSPAHGLASSPASSPETPTAKRDRGGSLAPILHLIFLACAVCAIFV